MPLTLRNWQRAHAGISAKGEHNTYFTIATPTPQYDDSFAFEAGYFQCGLIERRQSAILLPQANQLAIKILEDAVISLGAYFVLQFGRKNVLSD